MTMATCLLKVFDDDFPVLIGYASSTSPSFNAGLTIMAVDNRGDPSVLRYPGGASCSIRWANSAVAPLPILVSAYGDALLSVLLPIIRRPSSRPKSRLHLRSACVSSRKSIPIVIPNSNTPTQTKLGSRNGYLAKIVSRGNSHGYASQGVASAPPIAGPIIEPRHQTNGMIE